MQGILNSYRNKLTRQKHIKCFSTRRNPQQSMEHVPVLLLSNIKQEIRGHHIYSLDEPYGTFPAPNHPPWLHNHLKSIPTLIFGNLTIKFSILRNRITRHEIFFLYPFSDTNLIAWLFNLNWGKMLEPELWYRRYPHFLWYAKRYNDG